MTGLLGEKGRHMADRNRRIKEKKTIAEIDFHKMLSIKFLYFTVSPFLT